MSFEKIIHIGIKRTIILIHIFVYFVYADSDHQTDIKFHSHQESSLFKIQSVRNILGSFDPLEHSYGQLRAGYITFSDTLQKNKDAYAVGGHYHFTTKSWKGIQANLALYTILNLDIMQNQNYSNSGFFNAGGNSYILFLKAFLDGDWDKTKIRVGRQILNTPHLDSDDIRMMPNSFEAYTITDNHIKDIVFTAGFVTKMAGQGNGLDTSRFLKIEKVLGLQNKNSNGIFYASATYTGVEDFSLMSWYYNYHNIANIIYFESSYQYNVLRNVSLALAIQYNQSDNSGSAFLGKQNSRTYGISAEANFKDIGLTVLSAYTQDNGNGATGLSLGGGPFFTSMEIQTLDILGGAGNAWMIGAGHTIDYAGFKGITIGLAYAVFKAKETSLYASSEINAVLEYNWNKELSFMAVYASIDYHEGKDANNNPFNDYQQFRLIAKYNF